MGVGTVGNGRFHHHVLALLLRSAHQCLLAGEGTLLLVLVLGHTTCGAEVDVVVGYASEAVEVGSGVGLHELRVAIGPLGDGSILGEGHAEIVAGDGVALHLELALLLDGGQLAVPFLHEGGVGNRCARGVVG